MSVSDPLIKEIKAYTSKFLEKFSNSNSVTDESSDLLLFCHALEKIFNYGLLPQLNSLGFTKQVDPWFWLEKVANVCHPVVKFAYKHSVDKVLEMCTVQSNVGKFRLLVRLCLAAKCLHIPVEYLLHIKRANALYKESSIIGDEILAQILLSVLLQCSKIDFKLDTKNTSFLDITWRIPEVLCFEFVPCESLGLSVSFSGEKAIIVHISPNSVTSESGKIEVGDVLDNLNNIHICSATKGRLSSILRSSRKQPIKVTVVKAINSKTNELFPPMIKLLKDVKIDPTALREKYLANKNLDVSAKSNTKHNSSAGFKVMYLGSVNVGKRGDVKQIDKYSKVLLSPFHSSNLDDCEYEKAKKVVFFEVGEIGVKIVDCENSELLFKHSYMEISSCASLSSMPNYFAYVAGNEYCNSASNFVCYLFHSNSSENACTILQSIGQGFHRTHFAV